MQPIIDVQNVSKSFQLAAATVEVLKNVNLRVEKGEFISIMGPSGSGKSTLLYLMGGLDRVTQGCIRVNGVEIEKLNDEAESRMRRNDIGFVFQAYNLIDNLTLEENIVLPALLEHKDRAAVQRKAAELMERVGILGRKDHTPKELSGGEQQRTAICRALANAPRLLLADEPTGNLDPKTAEIVFQELIELIRVKRLAALIATHNLELAARMDRVLRMEGGQLVELEPHSLV
jgi:ABC-type lipoprotein export system ATPase subunit